MMARIPGAYPRLAGARGNPLSCVLIWYAAIWR